METAQQKRIFLIEDYQPLAHFLKLQLEAEGYRVHAEAQGTPALKYALDHPADFDLVILDLKLLDISGLEVCKQLRRITGALPILMLTGLGEPIDQLRGIAHGADAYLKKPCETSLLLKTIDSLLS